MWTPSARPWSRKPATRTRQGSESKAKAKKKTKKVEPKKVAAKPASKPVAKPEAKADKKAKFEARAQAKPNTKSAKQTKDNKTLKPSARPTVAQTPRAAGPPADPIAASSVSPQALPPPANTIITAAAIDVAAVKRAIDMVRTRKQTDASEVKKSISDPAAKKLVEWVILRSDNSGAEFSRYAAFITANSTLAEHRYAATQGRGHGVPGPAAERPGAILFLPVPAAFGQGTLRLRPRAAGGRRPPLGGRPGARSLAL